MNQTYFIGANSKNGFSSLYDSFPSERGSFTHIIKGGPGTGKSSFMKKIAARAESNGLDVHRVLCSGDPDSLDGVFIPEFKTAWVDGTSPHAGEPAIFGVDSDYVNLGQFCRTPLPDEAQARVKQLTLEYKSQYSRAYACLQAADALRKSYPQVPDAKAVLDGYIKRIKGIVSRYVKASDSQNGICSYRFISAISCRGVIRLDAELLKLCKPLYVIDNSLQMADILLKAAADEALAEGAEVIICPGALDPDRLEAVILPGCSTGFVCGELDGDDVRHIRPDTALSARLTREQRREIRDCVKLEERIIELAVAKLNQAKTLHDELESEYKKQMDFAALTKFTDRELNRIFG